MKVITLLIFSLIFSSNCFSQTINNCFEKQSYFEPKNEPIVFLCDSILKIAECNDFELNNLYVIKDLNLDTVLSMTQKFNEIYLFDSLGNKFKLFDKPGCSNNSNLLKMLNFSSLKLKEDIKYDWIINLAHPITLVNSNNKFKYYAVIFWSTCLGIRYDDSPFEWERILKNRFGNSINIVKINIDVNSSFNEETKNKKLRMYQNIFKKIKK
jgi:hypothetical protein